MLNLHLPHPHGLTRFGHFFSDADYGAWAALAVAVVTCVAVLALFLAH